MDGAGLLESMLESPVVVVDSRMQAGERLSPEQIIVDKPGIDVLIVEIDRLVSTQVDAILHFPKLQALESAWRSLRYVVANVNFRENVQVFLLNCNKDDLIADFEDAPEIAKSGLYRLVYSTEYGTFGGEPYGVICADFQFDAGPVDMALLSSCAAVATMSHVPFIANAAPRFFGEDSFDNLATYDDVRAVFQSPLYTRWHSFRDSEDSRYVALCLPRFLLREPYQRQHVHAFTYIERTTSKADYLWGHASFAFCTRVADSFARYRWSPNIVGPTAGGAVDGLPMIPFSSMHGIELRMPTEIQLTERHEFELSEEGFMGLVFLKGTDNACFFSANSCQKPKTFQKTPEGREAELGARLGAQLPYIFIVCRIAHYLKVMQREEIGRHLERSDLERELNDWLRKYVSDMDNPAPAVRGKRPLRQARVKVEEVPGQAGWYRAHLLLRPHLKYMGASFTLSLVGKLEREAGS
ncbi:type VI secretion system contractile sheath large subunit [Nannocystaceae bacterium ST9]